MIAEYIAAGAAVAAVVVSIWNTIRIQKVHVLVNNQLDRVMGHLEERTAERDQLRTTIREQESPS
jgi:hypothetical protein